jgi:hypothetical protein
MKYIPPGLIALLMAGAVAACLASHRVYGQALPPGSNPVDVWRESSQGMSSNAALAFYRLRNNSTVPTPLHPRFQNGAGASLHVNGQSTPAGSLAPFSGRQTTVYRQPTGKPFENVRPAPTAFERYWPLMLEGRQDPKTGLIIWSLP